MAPTRIKKTRNQLAVMYGLGILFFTAAFGFMTLLVKFIGMVKAAM
jgi:hypothetical protein